MYAQKISLQTTKRSICVLTPIFVLKDGVVRSVRALCLAPPTNCGLILRLLLVSRSLTELMMEILAIPSNSIPRKDVCRLFVFVTICSIVVIQCARFRSVGLQHLATGTGSTSNKTIIFHLYLSHLLHSKNTNQNGPVILDDINHYLTKANSITN